MVLGQARAQMAALDRQIMTIRRKLTGGDAKLSADEEALNAGSTVRATVSRHGKRAAGIRQSCASARWNRW